VIGQDPGRRTGADLQLLQHLFRDPVVNVKPVEEVTGKKGYHVFGFDRFLQLFQEREERG